MNKIFNIFAVLSLIVILQSCQQPGHNSTGSEYMPDMGHSIAYEANYYAYYKPNTWGTQDEYYKYAQPRYPVKGTVPIGTARNNTKPYLYPDSEEGRARAMEEIINNPLPITKAGLAHGKELFNIYCAICHGEKADGNGYLVRDDGGVYPVSPSNLLLDNFVSSSNGLFYHTIMRGRNMMGAYADKLDYEDRWNVIHYIRSLQAKSKKLKYDENENTLNDSAIPMTKWNVAQ